MLLRGSVSLAWCQGVMRASDDLDNSSPGILVLHSVSLSCTSIMPSTHVYIFVTGPSVLSSHGPISLTACVKILGNVYDFESAVTDIGNSKGIANFSYSIIRPANMFEMSPSDMLPFLRQPLATDICTSEARPSVFVF